MALVAVLLMAACPAFAGGGEKGDLELGIYGGYGWLDDYGFFHPKNHTLFGARLGYFLSPRWGLEVSGQRLSTETDYNIIGVANEDVHLDSYRLNALYNFGAGEEFRPFLTAGVGKEMFHVENFGESCDLGWNAGAGFRYFMSPHWNLRADGRYISTHVGDQIDARQNNVEATLGLGFVFGGKKAEAYEAPHAEEPRANQSPTVSCASERQELLPGESVKIQATASDPEGDRLTYDWSTSAGRVSGNGATAVFDFTGVTPPATATITVRVSDGHGNTASCDNAVRLREPARPAEAISCIAAGFARDFAGISNIDKACLDDVAQRLSADPRASVIVIGHADSHEKSASVAQRRADAVKEYLVKERSIEASRITTRSAAATKPVDNGTDAAAQARNRRVEVWFVPEGATVPK
ncbi:MAG TPA: outer membrane beta-barrel protein [Candidatus Eisenbacteria bacterium]